VRDQTGLRTVFHHHCAGFIETPNETHRLLEMTDASFVGLCFDTGHWAYAGGDAVGALRLFGERVWHVHFKDCYPDIADRASREHWDYFTAVRNGVFYGLGGGEVDFGMLLKELRRRDYSGWIVVEDELPPGMGDPQERARLDREYLLALGV
jgi:inosose dehydratase